MFDSAQIAPPALALRDYQVVDIAKLRGQYAHGKRAVLYQLATGGGKTVVFSHIVQAAAAKGKRVAVLAHRRELISQASAKLDWCGVAHGIVAAGLDRDHDARVLVASIQTITARGPASLGDLDFIVADEAHHCRADTWTALLQAHPRAKLLGVTATPARTDGRGLGLQAGGLFDGIVCGPTMQTLVDAGHLAATRCFVPPRRIDTAGLRQVAGDWAAGNALAERANVVTGDAIAEYRAKAAGKSAIAFCVTVEHAEAVAADFTAAGFRAACVHGGTPKDQRDALIAALGSPRTETSSIDILTSCDLISEGLDVPSVGAVILLRPTASLILCLQQIGRGMRPKADGAPLIVLDHAGNTLRHGLPEEDREWTLDGITKQPRAAAVVGADGVNQGRKREVEEVAGALVEAQRGDRLAKWRRMSYGAFKGRRRTEDQVRDYCAAKGYKQGWVWHYLRDQEARFAVAA
jgi:DNA repair protein RadD